MPTPRSIGATVLLTLVGGVLFGLPLGWMVLTLLAEPVASVGSVADGYRRDLLVRTLAYNGLAALIAGVLALPAAKVIGCGRGVSRSLILLLAPASLLVPSLVYAYGFQQALRLAGVGLEPGSTADVIRCAATLGCWLWGVVALSVGLSWRRLDASIIQQARLDGAEHRVTARLLAVPFLAGVMVAAAVAMQEFGVYEPTGISVAATETRMVFDTGAFSSPENPITQPLGGGVAQSDQAFRAAAALRTSAPSLVATLALFGGAWVLARRLLYRPAEAPDPMPPGRAGVAAHACAWGVVALSLGVPLTALAISLREPANPMGVFRAFAPQLGGSLLLAGATLAGGLVLATLATVTRPRLTVALSVVTFLSGGLLVAVALIRIYNRPLTAEVYDTGTVAWLAYLSRFGFLSLIAGAATFSPSYARLRELAVADGASPWQVAVFGVLPAAWPALLAAAAGGALLSLGEVPATVLLSPQRPPLLTPLLMTWVHMQRYDPMIQACLLLAAIVLVGAAMSGAVLWLATRSGLRGTDHQKYQSL